MHLTRRGRLVAAGTVVAVAVVAAAYVLTRTSVGAALGVPTAPPCRVTAGGTTSTWSRTDAMTATTVTGVGMRIGASDNGVAAAVTRGLAADGKVPVTPAQARDIYRRLPDRAKPTAAELALARALLGHDGQALTCTVSLASDLPRQDPAGGGLTVRADTVRLAAREVFGKQTLGGFSPTGVTTGHIEGSAHYEGRAIDIFFRPVNAGNQQRGWAEAQWAVAHAARLHVATVIFDRRIWSAHRSMSGWREYRYPGGPTDNPILLHLDHVHIDVVEGS
jgi:hypothetical protein